MGFKKQYDLSQFAEFRGSVRIAMAQVATEIAGEAKSSSSKKDIARGRLATAVLQKPDDWIDPFAYAVAQNPTFADFDGAAVPKDADIKFTVSSVWSDMAGVHSRVS